MNGKHHDDDDPIVISGIAGRYPDCDSFNEFKEALLAGVDLVTEDDRRWKPGIYNTPKSAGKINNIEYFDAGYFGILPRQVDVMDPKHRVVLETAYEALVDAGVNPKEVAGTKKGVYLGLGGFDNSAAYKEVEKTNGYALIGSCLCQAANRVSYVFDLKGPSFVLDTACASGMYALSNAVEAMERGEIDGALVSAVNIVMHPFETSEFNALNMLAADGKCKVFSTERDGFGRSEAIITVFLQRRSACRRLYSTVLGTKMNCDGYKVEGITYPSYEGQLELMQGVYKQKHLNPNDVTYVEMHGTGTPAGDIVECKSVVDFFCKNRKKPLLVGGVKSNMGHSEVSAGLCSLSKVLIAMETGIIPKNLHCEKMDYTLPGIKDGKLKVVTDNLPWDGGMVSLNCFGFGGANAHLVIKSHDIVKKDPSKRSHRLVTVSGRTEEAVKHLLDKAQEHKDDAEFLALIDQIHKINVEGHPFRGYSVLKSNPTTEITRTPRKKRAIWYIYAGMGSQWTGMSKDLMQLDVYRNTIKKCAKALKPYNIDLEHMITTDDATVFDDIVNCFCAIVAAEIALTDVLRAFGIEPDGFAGHSLGEVGCAYCNGDLTAEQAVLLGYARGYGMLNSTCTKGQMAAVGLGKEQLLKYLPEDVFIACANSSNSCTLTGLQKPIESFVDALSKKGVFTRLVQSAGYAFHSKFIHPAVPHLEDFASKVVTNPKPRSPKWISSSVHESEWDTPEARLNSAKYHSNNFKSPVLFDQVLKYIPKDAIVVEIAPHGLLTSILKKEIGPEGTFLSLANRTSKDNVDFLLSNIGLLYVNGGQPDLRRFYPEVSFPVGRGTPNIGSLVKWDHSVKWLTPYYEINKPFGKKITINTGTDEYAYLKGHNIDGRVLMPATGYLELVWRVLAHMTTIPLEQLPVTFQTVKFIRATILPEGEDVVFYVNIMKQSGYFEIFEGGSVCCSGTILQPKNINDEFLNIDLPMPETNGSKPLLKHDVYKWFHLKRYKYAGEFQGLDAVDVTGTLGKADWNGHFTSFLDTMIQIPVVPNFTGDLLLPSRLQKLVINPVEHLKEAEKNKKVAIYHDKYLKVIKTRSIEIINLEVLEAPKRQKTQSEPILQSQVFVPYLNKTSKTPIDTDQSLTIAFQIIFENNGLKRHLNVLDICQNKENSLMEAVKKAVAAEPIANVTFVDQTSKSLDVLLCSDGNLDRDSIDLLVEDGFVLFCGLEKDCELGLPVVYENSLQGKGIYLLRKVVTKKPHVIIEVSNNDLQWLPQLQSAIKQKDLIFVKNHKSDTLCGVVGLVKCLNLEPTEKASIKCLFVKNAEVKDLEQQLSKRLTINVFENGVWGSYRHLLINNLKPIEVSDACNYAQTVGDLSSMMWVERPQIVGRSELGSPKVFAHYAALNFKDIMVATGKLSTGLPNSLSTDPEVQVGFEYSGITEFGKRLMGIAANCIGLQLLPDPLFSWEVPKEWTLEEGATVPVVYATCFYGMIVRGQLQKGESILIHAGAGGIGIAAISIGLSLGCEIFTTVGSKEKKEFLLKRFPKLNPGNIGNSRNATFEQMILRNTKGRGVDMVLNSLSAELFQASIRCIAQRGRFVEIGKVDLWAGTPISASLFSKNSSFHGVLLDDLFGLAEHSHTKKEINRLVTEGISKGVVQPLPRVVFNEDQIEDAYRFLSTGKHKGKVIIKIRSESTATNLQRTIKAMPRIYFNPDKTYILIGGLGGVGLELADFLIKRCAKKIILNSRRGVSNGYQQLCLKKWADLKEGVIVKINVEDTSRIEGAKKLVAAAEEMGPVGGVFNLGLVLEDALFINQTPEKFQSVFKPKVYSGSNMDEVTRSRCPELDHFVVFSSLTSGRGNPGQSNYGMANSALERMCEKRRADGFPGLAVQYGPIGDVGAVAENDKFDKAVIGMDSQTISSCLNALETFMLQPHAVGSSFVLQESSSTTNTNSDKSPVETVAHILGIKDISQVDINQNLGDMGLDSLMSAEIKQTLYRNFQIELSVEDIRDLTLKKITLMASKESDNKPLAAANGTNGHHQHTFNAMLSDDSMVEIINDKSFSKKVFFVPPIEGTVDVMLPLADKVNANVYGLQFTKALSADSISDHAKNFIKTIKEVQKKGPYVLCGYSYGGLLGFEISAQLEKMDEQVVLYMVDGAPSFVKKILEEKFNRFGKMEKESKKAILKAFAETFDEVNIDKVKTLLSSSLSYEDQVLKVGDLVAENTTYNSADVAESARRYLERIAAAFYYNPNDKVKSDVTLIRSDTVLKQMPEDYDLQRICEKPIHLHTLQGNHKQIISGSNLQRIADMINTIL